MLSLAKPARLLHLARQHPGLTFALLVFLVFFQAGLFASYHFLVASVPTSYAHQFWLSLGSPPHLSPVHPIPDLMSTAEARFRRKLARQSKSLRAAVKEYKRRYQRNPPRGFDRWWKFCTENKVRLVDEYDAIVEDLAPFWEVGGAELRRRAVQVALLPSIDIVRVRGGNMSAININGGVASDAVSGRASGLMQMMENFYHSVREHATDLTV
jgi:hypothetical protein